MVKAPAHLAKTLALITGREELPDKLLTAQRVQFERLRRLVADQGTVGVAISDKEIEGSPTGEQGIVFYVREKALARDVDPELLVPPVIAGPSGRAIYTDVRPMGDVRAHANISPNPIRAGFSIGHPVGRAGSLGAIVRRGRRQYVLGAMHVLANDGLGTAGDPIHFPSPRDQPASSATRLGVLEPFPALVSGAAFPNEVDAALALIDDARLSDIDSDVPGSKFKPLRAADPSPKMRVLLNGRTSGDRRTSNVRGVRAHVGLSYPRLGFLLFRDQIECEPYAQEGDSGALVLDADSGSVVGLHIGGSEQASFFTPIRRVLAALSVSF